MKKTFLLALGLFFLSSFVCLFADEDEPLDPAVAFQLQAYALDANTIRAEWKIADGYYLYKHKFKFASKTTGYELGEAVIPKGKEKIDEFFGKVESYRKQVRIDIPVSRAAGAATKLELETISQGCADIGICYPPQTVAVSFDMPPADEMGISANGSSMATPSLLDKLGSSFGMSNNAQPDFLPVDQAFVLSVEYVDGNTLVARWDVAEGYYLYKDKMHFTLVDGDGVKLGEPLLPKGKEKFDEYFGKMESYFDEVSVPIPLFRSNTDPVDISLKVEYQGCAEAGFCYPPQSSLQVMSLPKGKAGDGKVDEKLSFAGTGGGSKTATDDLDLSEQDAVAKILEDSNFFWVVLSFFGFGLLLAFTPCVFPMVPILSSIIVGQGESITARKGFMISLIYVLSASVMYVIAGVIAGLGGANLQVVFQNPYVLSVFATVFVALAFSMFGFYELQLPASWQAKLTEVSNSQQGGTFFGVVIMGLLSALIVGPCVAAPLAGALIYIGQTGDAVLGGFALFALSMGMGAPLLLIGASAGKLLPRAGGWMEVIKAVFGVLMLGVAVWLLERIIPAAMTLALWAALLIVSAIYMGALERLPDAASGWKKLWKGLGIIMLIYGGLLLIGAASGGKDPLQPMQGVMGSANVSHMGAGSAASSAELVFKKIKNIAELDNELAAAKAAGKPVMLDFYADWCVSCKEYERYTFSDPRVQAKLNSGVILKVDVTKQNEDDIALQDRFSVIGPPMIVFWDNQGVENRKYRLVGFKEADEFLSHLDKAFN
ncbi:MAG: protein-disulfide reductase DsbD [Gammaproteobacteria bacterium]|nr:protein-disulfide reductase DsbD [Gammaproteobacteria bacterium]